ncbi:hypothetical protein G6F63_014960 [Rhizopus arrhizus]|nr:hypothetical protein G6F63_014960 [Rhizopus arrhizus]
MAQFDFPVGDVAGNTERIIEMIGQARDEYGAELVMFPELAVSGYPPEDLLLRPGFLYECEQAMGRIAAACRGITAVVACCAMAWSSRPTASASCPTMRYSTSVATSMWTRTAAAACSRSMAFRCGC